jgi:hypothetical protein
MPTKPILAAKKLIKGRKLTSSELGYKRDPKTGRLTKPGTKAFNEKVSFIEEDNRSLLGEYKNRIQNTSGQEKEINARKFIDRQKQLDRKLSDLKRQREHDLNVAERKRLQAIKKRRINYLIVSVDSLLKASGRKLTVSELKNRLVEKVYKKLDQKARAEQKGKLIVTVPSYFEVNKKVTAAFYSEIEKSVISVKLKNMTAEQTVKILDGIYTKVGTELTK